MLSSFAPQIAPRLFGLMQDATPLSSFRATAMGSYTALSTTALLRELGPELSVFAIPLGVKLEFMFY